MSIKIVSNAFKDSEMIPSKYTCKGENISPQISWQIQSDDKKIKSIALIMNDPDAPNGDWVHWVVFDIPSDKTELAENETIKHPIGIGKNSWGKNEYGGPCPPSGTHRYFFKIYVLDNLLVSGETTTKDLLLKAMKRHIIDSGELMGKYSK